MAEPVVTLADVRAAKLCFGGARGWFNDRNLSWSDFLSHGLPISTVASYKDAFGNMAIAQAKIRMGI